MMNHFYYISVRVNTREGESPPLHSASFFLAKKKGKEKLERGKGFHLYAVTCQETQMNRKIFHALCHVLHSQHRCDL